MNRSKFGTIQISGKIKSRYSHSLILSFSKMRIAVGVHKYRDIENFFLYIYQGKIISDQYGGYCLLPAREILQNPKVVPSY